MLCGYPRARAIKIDSRHFTTVENQEEERNSSKFDLCLGNKWLWLPHTTAIWKNGHMEMTCVGRAQITGHGCSVCGLLHHCQRTTTWPSRDHQRPRSGTPNS